MQNRLGPLRLLAILLALGAAYGLTIGTCWNEMAEFGQVLAGKVPYSKFNYFYVGRHADLSVQTILPAFLYQIGLSSYVVALVTSALTCALAFAAWGMLGFALSNSVWFGLATPLISLAYIYPNSHYYPVIFPMEFFIFGQVGTYLAVLTISIWVIGFRRLSLALLGILVGIHLPWSMGVAFGIFVETWLARRWELRKWAAPFLLSTAVSVALLVFGGVEMKKNMKVIAAPEQQDLMAVVGKLNLEPLLTGVETADMTPVDPSRRTTFQGHNLLFAGAPRPVKAAAEYFLHSGFFLLLTLLAFRLRVSAHLLSLARVILSLALVALVIKLFEEVDPSFASLGWAGTYVIRTIPNRWLNLSLIAVPMLVWAILFDLGVRKRWYLALALTFYVLTHPQYFLFNQDNPLKWTNKYLINAFLILMVVYFLQEVFAVGKYEGWKRWTHFTRRYDKIMIGVLALLLAVGAGLRLKANYQTRPLFQEWLGKEEFLRTLRSARGSIVLVGGIQSVRGMNVQLLSDRSYHVLNSIALPLPDARTLKVYCYTDPHIDYGTFMTVAKDCFEQRKQAVWRYVGFAMNANQVLVKSDYNLDLPLLYSDADFKIYEIPQVELDQK